LRLVAIVGTKKAGKTTVVERMLGELTQRGARAGTLKLIETHGFTIHADGRDTARHWGAGAHFSIALAPGETAVVRRTDGTHETLEEVMELVPPGTHALLCEGLVTGGADVRTVLCLREPGQAAAFMRGLPGDAHPVAVSGSVASSFDEVAGLPALDVTDPRDLSTLVDLVMEE
jgi:molybdopterin-guanine dinucleotide biosynthesis protein MobB